MITNVRAVFHIAVAAKKWTEWFFLTATDGFFHIIFKRLSIRREIISAWLHVASNHLAAFAPAVFAVWFYRHMIPFHSIGGRFDAGHLFNSYQLNA